MVRCLLCAVCWLLFPVLMVVVCFLIGRLLMVDVNCALIVFVVCCVLYAVGWFVFVVGCCVCVVVRCSLSAVCRLLSFFV